MAPVGPFGPVVPGDPVAPVGPVGPVGPCNAVPMPSWPLASIKTGLPLLLSTPSIPAIKVLAEVPWFADADGARLASTDADISPDVDIVIAGKGGARTEPNAMLLLPMVLLSSAKIPIAVF